MKRRTAINKYSILTSNISLFAISSIGSKIISFLLIPLYTSVLSTEQYGIADILTTTSSLLLPIMTLNVHDAVLRYTLDKDYAPSDVLATGFRVNIYGALFMAGGLMAFCSWKVTNFPKDMAFFLYMLYLSGSLHNMLTMYLKASDKVAVLVYSGLIHTGLTCILNIIFLLFLEMELTGYLLALIISKLIAVFYQIMAGDILKNVSLAPSKKLTVKMLAYSTPLIADALAWWVNNASGRYVVTMFFGVAANGLFSVAYKIPLILSTVQTVFYNAWSISAISEFDPKDEDGFIGNICKIYSIASVIACSAIMLLNIPIAKLLYANNFFEAWKYVPFLLVGTVFNGIIQFEGCLFLAVKKTRNLSKSTIIGAFANILCNILFVPYMGILGASLASLCGYMITLLVRSWDLKKIITMKTDTKRIWITYLAIIVQSVVSITPSLYWIQLAIFIAILVFEKEYIRIIVNKCLSAKKG